MVSGDMRVNSLVGLVEAVIDKSKLQAMGGFWWADEIKKKIVGPDGLEPSTHGLKVRCSTD